MWIDWIKQNAVIKGSAAQADDEQMEVNHGNDKGCTESCWACAGGDVGNLMDC